MKVLNKRFDSNFVIMPSDCNYMTPMVFGGFFFAKMDLAAAMCVSRALHDSDCNAAVTHKFSGTFHKPTFCGELIFLSCLITECKTKAIVVLVDAFRERRATPGRDLVAEAEFVFVTQKDGEYSSHGLTL